MTDWLIPLSGLEYDHAENEAVLRVLASQWLSMGAEVEAFEREFAALLGTPHALAVANGTAALHLAYLALDIGPGDEVIQPAINFVAAANMTLGVGATPVFADIAGLDAPVIDPEDIERRITSRTKAVLVMYYGGLVTHAAEIRALCRKHNLLLVEDACHAAGARYFDADGREPNGEMAGAIGDVSCFSFFSNKNIATGEGGALATRSDEIAHKLRRLRSHGMTTMTWDRHKGHAHTYDVVLNGFNYRMDELHAALGRAQLRKLMPGNEKRRALTRLYRQRLQGLVGWTLPFQNYQSESSGHLMVAVAPNNDLRNRARAALQEKRIQTSLHYPCVPDFTAFKAVAASGLERARAYADRAMTLPLWPSMTPEQVELVCAALKDL